MYDPASVYICFNHQYPSQSHVTILFFFFLLILCPFLVSFLSVLPGRLKPLLPQRRYSWVVQTDKTVGLISLRLYECLSVFFCSERHFLFFSSRITFFKFWWIHLIIVTLRGRYLHQIWCKMQLKGIAFIAKTLLYQVRIFLPLIAKAVYLAVKSNTWAVLLDQSLLAMYEHYQAVVGCLTHFVFPLIFVLS